MLHEQARYRSILQYINSYNMSFSWTFSAVDRFSMLESVLGPLSVSVYQRVHPLLLDEC